MLVIEIGHKTTELNSEITVGFTKNLLQLTGLHTYPAEHGRLCCRQGLPEMAFLLTSMWEMAAHALSWSYVPFSATPPQQAWEYSSFKGNW